MDKDAMDDVIRLNDFLDSALGLAKKIIAAAVTVGLLVVPVVSPLWQLVSQQPARFFAAGLLLFTTGGLAGAAITLIATKGRTRRQIETRDKIISIKDEEISSLKKLRHEQSGLFAEFRSLTHDEQRQIVSVMLSEPAGIAPSDDQRKHMGEWKAMKDFLRHDPVSDRMHLVDGVRDMLLDNPAHVYDLMAARVADLQEQRSGDLDDIAALEEKISDLEKQIAAKPDLEPMSNEDIEAMFGSGARTPRGRIVRSIDAVRTLPAQTVGAMVDAFDNEGHAELGAHEQWVRKSIKDRDGIFRIGRMYFMGYPGEETGDYYLMKEWLEFMDDPKNLAEMRQMARS